MLQSPELAAACVIGVVFAPALDLREWKDFGEVVEREIAREPREFLRDDFFVRAVAALGFGVGRADVTRRPEPCRFFEDSFC